MRIVCPECQSPNVRPEALGSNPAGKPRDHHVAILVVCLGCGTVSDVLAQVTAAEVAGDEVLVGAHRLRWTRES